MVAYAPQVHTWGPNFDNPFGLFWPHTAKTWTHFFSLLLGTGDGLFTVALLCISLFVLYLIIGQPIETEQLDQAIDNKRLWRQHYQRFLPSSSRIFSPSSKEEEEHTTPHKERENQNGFIQTSKTSLQNQSQYTHVPIHTVSLKLDDNRSIHSRTKVMVVGNPKTATLSIITHHDICTSVAFGLLPFSVQLCSETKGRICIYHISAPGHFESDSQEIHTGDIDPNQHDNCHNDARWTMDKLAHRMNFIVSKLNIQGRCIYLGEGAGANICLRAAAAWNKNNTFSSPLQLQFQFQFQPCSVILISPECGAPTFGNIITSFLVSFLFRFCYTNTFSSLFPNPTVEAFSSKIMTFILLKMYGIPWNLLHPSHFSTTYPLSTHLFKYHVPSIIAYANGYYSTPGRSRLVPRTKDAMKRRQHTLQHIHGCLILCADTSMEGKRNTEELVTLWTNNKNDGVVRCSSIGVETVFVNNHHVGRTYTVGGGALLVDSTSRVECIQAIKLFLEGV